MKQPRDLLEKIDHGLARGEKAILVVVMITMIGLATVQLVLRKFFDTGFEWADIMVRQMVLWLAFLGGALATHEGRHIAIDAVGKFLPPRRAAALRAVTSVAAMVMSLVLVRASLKYLQAEIEDDATIFESVPAWPFEAIMPVAFSVIAFHFLVAAWHQLLVAIGKREPTLEFEAEAQP